MTIASVTNIAGPPGSGRTLVTRAIEYRLTGAVKVLDQYTVEPRQLLRLAAESNIKYHILLTDDHVYDLIDYQFGNVPRYYISLQHTPATVFNPEPEPTPLFD